MPDVITYYNLPMRLTLRKIGNSVGVIIPKHILDRWGVAEGDELVLAVDGIRPVSASGNAHQRLDELKRKIAVEVAARCTAQQIRAHSLANLHRWKTNGVWGAAYEEW